MKALFFFPILFIFLFPEWVSAQKLACMGFYTGLAFDGSRGEEGQMGLMAYYPITKKWGFMPEFEYGVYKRNPFNYNDYPYTRTDKLNSFRGRLIGTFSLYNSPKIAIPNIYIFVGYAMGRMVWRTSEYLFLPHQISPEFLLFESINQHDVFLGLGFRKKIGQKLFVTCRPEISPFIFNHSSPNGQLRLNLEVGYVR